VHLLPNAHWIARDFASVWAIRARRVVRRADALAYLDGAKQPIVVVPGVYENWEFMKPIAERLHASGHPVHIVTALGRNVAPIPDAAASVHAYLVEHDLTGVVLVGHSKGGLIGKHVMLVDDTDGRVERLVAVASPFAGSRYARYMPARPLRQFVPTATTLSMLAADASVNARITSVYPRFDGHVPDGSALDGATNVEVPVRGHFRVLVEKDSIDAIIRAVDGVV
jgi:triacylglycerol esterase/lipase EstA (alpha/beta hydrolase family)